MKRRHALAAVFVVASAALAMTVGVRVNADAPPGHFPDRGDGTIADNVTGLPWQQAASTTTLASADAVTYCSGSPLSGGGWRLPTILELRSIVDESRASPAIDPLYFPATPSASFWSETSVAGFLANVWVLNFEYGSAESAPAAVVYYARCVRPGS